MTHREAKPRTGKTQDRPTDRAYRADAVHELDLLAMLSELAEQIEDDEPA